MYGRFRAPAGTEEHLDGMEISGRWKGQRAGITMCDDGSTNPPAVRAETAAIVSASCGGAAALDDVDDLAGVEIDDVGQRRHQSRVSSNPAAVAPGSAAVGHRCVGCCARATRWAATRCTAKRSRPWNGPDRLDPSPQR